MLAVLSHICNAGVTLEMPSHCSVTDVVHQKFKKCSCTVKLPRSGNSCMFGENLVVLVGYDLLLFLLSEENRKSNSFLLAVQSGKQQRTEGNPWCHLVHR